MEDGSDKFDAAIERNTRAFERLEAFLRDERLLHDRRMAAVERSYERMERRFELQIATLDDLLERSREHTRAIRSLLDRWGEGPTPAS